MTSIELSRFVFAEPSSVALVLAGPAARELWPRATDRAVAAVGHAATDITVDPPRRTGVGFVAHITVREQGRVVGDGKLTIRPVRGDAGGCDVALVLSGVQDDPLRRDAKRYLDNVARVSRERSSAA